VRELLQARLGDAVGEQALASLSRYAGDVLEANRSFNVTGAKTPEELAEHIADSLTLLRDVEGDLVDVGSGAGFPAIPLAIASGLPVCAIESNRKKAALLERLMHALGLRGTVVAERAEVAAHRADLRECFSTGTARAVSTAPAVAELLLPFLRVGGVALLQRGVADERERIALADAALVLGAEVESERPIDGQRRIVVLRKIAPTPSRFPRRAGIVQKRPLCSR
jgi:16S rRNA (guanine527-N7)-methyltransferase